MAFVYFLILALVSILCLRGVAASADDAKPRSTAATTVSRETVKTMSQAQIETMLRKLESRPAPPRKMGAMCYSVATPPGTADYVCPVCGEKTRYKSDEIWLVDWELNACRREFANVKKNANLSLTLDESSFCSKCSPKATEHQLALVVVYPDGRRHVNAPISSRDLVILGAFLKGETACSTFNNGSIPLKPKLPRLRELLGVPAAPQKTIKQDERASEGRRVTSSPEKGRDAVKRDVMKTLLGE